MGSLRKDRWAPTPDLGLPRSAREGCDYQAYVPDRLGDRRFRIDGGTAADVADAEAAVSALQSTAPALSDSEAVARLLLRAEAVASSRIEGLQVGSRRLLKEEFLSRTGQPQHDVKASEILGNIAAMHEVVAIAGRSGPVTVDVLKELHRTLFAGTEHDHLGGRLREEQNWIGGSPYNPCRATFVPPPPDLVEELLDDLCAFCSGDALSPVAQAAIAHAQFETIHPFADGNGRTGRALIHLILLRRGLVRGTMPPISLILATRSDEYVAGLTATRTVGPPDAAEAQDGIDQWLSTFASATTRAVSDAQRYQQEIEQIQDGWRSQLGTTRSDAAARRLIDVLPASPIITVKTAETLIGRSNPATNHAVGFLETLGILKRTTVGKRNRAFEAPEIIDTFTRLERRLASPDADTYAVPPVRAAVPRRPR